ncbi:hypothetical protein BWGOE8_07980 [Bacillus mycoides]|uniref:Uncharacterized protein n=1 Tax=Bacillus mycoides TaxID=1405 RepID=A0A1E8BC26_BACMY|nr:hypothetical protein BWGOE8_07980 [Bacillus mycoides]OFD84185.1 hypothetical protein BWGOE9_07820 [Bacillus mycoides]OFD86203.1 hypothetical protein BWGOE10_07900 [Bacillus mycoides]
MLVKVSLTTKSLPIKPRVSPCNDDFTVISYSPLDTQFYTITLKYFGGLVNIFYVSSSPAPNFINIIETLQASIKQAKIKKNKRSNEIDLLFFKADYISAFRAQMIELILINNNIPLLPYDLPFSLIMSLIFHSITPILQLHVKNAKIISTQVKHLL